MSKRVLVTGITGHDAPYRSNLRLERGYEVYGAYRRTDAGTPWRLAAKAAAELDWKPATRFDRLVEMMVADLDRAACGLGA